MCAPQGAPCKRAGGQAVRKARSGEHAAIAEEHAVLCAVPPCCPDSIARHDHRGCGQTLGVPPHSTAQAAACRVVKESGAGVAGAGCDGAESGRRLRCSASPSGTCEVGRGHGCGQRTRSRFPVNPRMRVKTTFRRRATLNIGRHHPLQITSEGVLS